METSTYTPSMAKRDSKRAIAGYKLRKHKARQAKLNKSKSSKAKAISILGSLALTELAVHTVATV